MSPADICICICLCPSFFSYVFLDSDPLIQDAVPSISLLPTKDPNNYPGTQSNRDHFKASTITNTGIDGTCKDLPAGITYQKQRGKKAGSVQGISLHCIMHV